ncbi:hypothetical protein [Magnetofaba australis]|uniref:Uncharacterized protein n=1 Tax=Magnetofaba australis IT-1 TaxID=1434232 RepID=A0A1Y2K3A5_9PROT|nr:hypothetical protein [Magnetofaba australis]OSM01515.1 hypothetical protein MAIT1_01501 [Magnetofaba australis IT-1]
MIRYEIDLSQRLVIAHFIGEIDYAELEGWHLGLAANPDYAPDYSGVGDMRRAKMRISPADLKRIDKLNADRRIVTGRWALLVETPREAALAAQYEQVKDDKHPMNYFCTVAAASDYLGVDLSEYLTD